MPRENEDDYEAMSEVAKQLRQLADSIDSIVESAYNGSDENKFGAVGDVEEGRASRNISKNKTNKAISEEEMMKDAQEAVRIIKLNL